MPTCIQNYEPVPKEDKNSILTIRLKDAEHARFWRLMDVVKLRNPYAGKSDVLRELLGLNIPNVLTADEVQYFRTGNKTGDVLKEPPGIPFGGVASGGKTKTEEKRNKG